MINKGDKKRCVFYVLEQWYAEHIPSVNGILKQITNPFVKKKRTRAKELIASAIKDRNKQSTSIFKYVSKKIVTQVRQVTQLQMPLLGMVNLLRGRVFEGSLVGMCALTFDDFDNKDKIIQRIKDVPLSRNTMKDRILKLAENVTDQQKMTLTPLLLYRYVLTKSIDTTKSARLAVFARYCVENIIKEELIAITSLLTTTKGTDICTAVRNSLAEKEIDLKNCLVTTDGAPNMELLPYGQTLNSDLYCQQLDRLKLAIEQKFANRRGVVFHQDNVRPKTSVVTRQKLWELGWEVLMHPSYSPDLAPRDKHLFLALQNFLSDKELGSREDCENRLLEFFANKDQDFYGRGIMKLPL
ncbi:histone-lysine N-methyltransferase SETMAR [Trichonephila clavipes]|uniref:Histone-lysine N-methyltransferase SETMAR n=1 Tax=Trichonephila clavipes TaxID=2585209 RepID=A0A8X6VK23_TRICX|nr:histone-lysine N-methyltransferase SETMAR [Trichonephila clavipes]